MTPDDRERNFEKALGRELRANGTKGLDCPDAETLAAYHERMLSPEEMAAQKSHIVNCPRCQEILATLEVTETISSGAEGSEKVLEMSAKLAPEAVPAEPAAARAKGAAVKEMPKRKTYLRWAVPAGAIAAGLLVWIAMNTGSRSFMAVKQNAPSAPVQVAENREAVSAELDKKKSELERTPAAKPEVADKISRGAPGRQDGTLSQYEVEPQTKTEDRKRAEVPRTTYDHGPRAAQNQMNQNQMSQNQAIQNNQVARDQVQAYGQRPIQPSEEKRLDDLEVTGRDAATLAQNAPRKEAQAKKAPVPAAAAPAPPPVGGAAGAGAGADMSKDAEVGQVSETVTVTNEAVAAADEQKADADKNAALMKLKGQMAGGLMAANLRDVKASTPGFVGTPDPRVFWFFMPNGIVYRSEDGGKTAKLQKTGEGLKFLAGSAPDAKTCWLLVEKGIVLRTTNGGKKWETVSAPADGNFTMITGIDANHALITDPAARVSYATADGGATWNVVLKK